MHDEAGVPQGDSGLPSLNPTTRFSDRAADYVQYRPGYPSAAMDAVLAGLPASPLVADVGAGTGISSRAVADRGVRVIAVEPNPEMRAAAAAHPRVEWRDGTAEATGLDVASIDLVLCAQAFHWFRVRESIAEFHRVLRARGRLVLLWNSRSRTDPLTFDYITAIHAVNGEHPAEQRAVPITEIDALGLFTPLSVERFDHSQRLDRSGLLGRAVSASYVPKTGEAFERLSRLLDEAFDRHRDGTGHVTMRYVTEVWRAERR
jgi:SAM-dependent methyltransferase